MTHRSRSRQLLFIVMAVLVPAGVLIGLAVRVIRQDAELAEARAVQERLHAVDQLGRELSARLEAIKLQEINRWIRTPAVPEMDQPPDSALVFVAPLNGDRLVLPWEPTHAASEPGPEFARYRQEGESREFLAKDLNGALDLYRRALNAASGQTERCEAMLLEARILLKRGRTEEAGRGYKTILKDCDEVTDPDGVAFSLYAAERLITALKDPGPAHEYVIARVNRTRWVAPYEAYMMRSLLKPAADDVGLAALQTIDRRIAELDQVRAFTKDFPRLRPLAETAWVAYGAEPWLVTVIPAEAPLPSLVFAVSSAMASLKFLPVSAALVTKEVADSEPLGDGFVGLHVKFKGGQFDPGAQSVTSSLYATGIALIVGITVLAGYLLLRDVNRDLRMAETRSQFVASVSHELKTPLTAIRMFAETLTLGRARDDRTRAEYLETILNESERLARLVDNVLDFSKIEQGKRIYRMRRTHLPEVVRSAAQAMRYPLAQQGFTLNVSIDESIRSLPADADALEQAILNLLSNAMKYSGAARQIDLSLKQDGPDAVIGVVDRGIGIEPEEQPRIFERFYRGRLAERELIAGTGLGLTVVQHVVQAHGGRVELQSAEGAGSTFSIRIPIPAPDTPA